MVAARSRGEAPLRDNQTIRTLLEGVKPGSTFWMVGDQTVLSQLPRAIPGGGPGTSQSLELPALKSLTVTAELDPEVSLDAVGEASDEAGAKNLADVVRGFVALAARVGLETILGAFLAGAVLGHVDRDAMSHPNFRAKLDAVGYGFVVPVFFVTSGFLITTLLVREWSARGAIDLAGFWVRRARRLLPALVVVMLGIAVYAVVFAARGELEREGAGEVAEAAGDGGDDGATGDGRLVLVDARGEGHRAAAVELARGVLGEEHGADQLVVDEAADLVCVGVADRIAGRWRAGGRDEMIEVADTGENGGDLVLETSTIGASFLLTLPTETQ